MNKKELISESIAKKVGDKILGGFRPSWWKERMKQEARAKNIRRAKIAAGVGLAGAAGLGAAAYYRKRKREKKK